MKTPESSTVLKKDETVVIKDTSEVAAEIIRKLDADYARHEVLKIAEWIHYLSTQD